MYAKSPPLLLPHIVKDATQQLKVVDEVILQFAEDGVIPEESDGYEKPIPPERNPVPYPKEPTSFIRIIETALDDEPLVALEPARNA